ncbi:MAG: hypothetical protein MH137_00540 [Flavobacteriales bacterium]|nr:hypothetical protein [Flavobacteriales bacterium]
MQTRLFPISDMAQQFAEACVMKNMPQIQNMLCDQGVYEIQNEELEIEEVGKEAFMEWFFPIMIQQLYLPFYLDQCNGCMKGKPVIIFLDGKFPRSRWKLGDMHKSGLMIEEKDNKIVKIMFCYSFCETTNSWK